MYSFLKTNSLLIILFSLSWHSYGQRNLSGKKGLIYTPSAEESKDGEFSIGYVYNPIDYSLRGNGTWAEQILYANINLLPRFQVSFFLLQQRADGKRKTRDGIGDRQLDLRYQILRETEKQPALALVLSSPFTIDAALQTHVLVASKTFNKHKISFTPSVGIGSPYYLYREENNLNNGNVFSELTFQKKSEDRYNNKYLVGLFGGIKCSFYDNYHILAEWDGQKVNTGLSATVFKKLNAQISLLNFNQASFGFSYTTNLKNNK